MEYPSGLREFALFYKNRSDIRFIIEEKCLLTHYNLWCYTTCKRMSC